MRLYVTLWLFILCELSLGQSHTIYLLSGQGSDERIYQEIEWDSNSYELVYLPYKPIHRGESMNAYAQRMAEDIDTSSTFTLVGVSLGGMLCCEMNTFLNPEKVIIISSAKSAKELPLRYRFQRFIPLYELLPKWWIKPLALMAQPIFEPNRKSHKEVFKSMLKSKSASFNKRSIRMIVRWNKETEEEGIIHIHGDNDHTLPVKRMTPTYVIENGSHMMTLTRAAEVSQILNEVLADK